MEIESDFSNELKGKGNGKGLKRSLLQLACTTPMYFYANAIIAHSSHSYF